jgi:chromosome segregation protein
MHLKDIYLENFKSFGRKLHVPFLPGYTTITGPNGSGKSNIGDAILFVLGPKSSKAIRVGKLTDLIFDGGKDKKPAGYCRVVLTFDNTDRIIPVDDNEVRLSRVVRLASPNLRARKEAALAVAGPPEDAPMPAAPAPTGTPPGEGTAGEAAAAGEAGAPSTEVVPAPKPRSGGPGYYSYFYVNERASSLQEFDNLLSHARISADGYNLVQQGDINRIVLMSNLERRRMLDGIAGITQYDEDIEKADDKRHATEENLGTIETLLDEVKRQVGQLQKERDSALKYKDLRDKRDESKIQAAFRRKQDVESEIGELGKQVDGLQKEQLTLGEEMEALQKKMARAKTDVEALENKLAEAGGADAQELRTKIDNLRLEMMRAKDAVDTNREKIKQLKETGARTGADIKALEKDIELIKADMDRAAGELADLREQEKACTDGLKQVNDSVARSDTKAFKIQRDLANLKKEIESKEDDQHKLLLEKERLEDRLNRCNQDIALTEENVKKYDFQMSDIEFDLKNIRSEAKSSTTAKRDVVEDYQTKKSEEEKLLKLGHELEEKVRELRRRWEQLKAEATAAANVQKGYTAAVESIMEARDKGELRGIHGTIAELATVKSEYDAALGIAAGGRMQSIVVDDDEAAARAINHLKQRKIGRAIFLPLNKMILGRPSGKALMTVKDPASVGYAMDLVKFKEAYRAAFWFVFGDTIVVKELASLRKLMGGVRLVTLDGDIAEPSGAMIGGTPEQAMLRFGAPSETELKKVGMSLKEAVEGADKVSARLAAIRQELGQMERSVTETRSRESEVELESAKLDFKKKEYAAARDALKKEKEAKLKEGDEARRAVERTGQKVTELEGVLETLRKERDDMSRSLVQATPQQLATKIKKLQDQLLKTGNDIRDRASALETSGAKLKLLEDKREELRRAVSASAKEIKECESGVLRSKDTVQQSSDGLNVLMEAEEKSSKEVREWQAKRDVAYKLKTDLETAAEKLNGKLETHGDLIISLRSKVRLLEDRHSEIMAEIGSSELRSRGKLPPLAELETAVKECELQMQALEPVNMLAIDEYEKQAKRSGDLAGELEQLRTQRENLIKLVEELNGKKKFGLHKVFDAVNRNFAEIYAELSAGGHAELSLENPDAPFEGGLIIKAQPKDKKTQRLESLSGGEKSLTALSLIFAIQAYQPSPFYLLDEVDMFLDAINAENVAAMIKKNSMLVQVVQITLRKVTLAKADHRYGVTMQGNGISDIIGNVRLTDVADDGRIAMPPAAAAGTGRGAGAGAGGSG